MVRHWYRFPGGGGAIHGAVGSRAGHQPAQLGPEAALLEQVVAS